jgi:hypothetical protein
MPEYAASGEAIEPPIFVLYGNGGLIGFHDVREAEDQVEPEHVDIIGGAWDSAGCVLDYRAAPGLRVILDVRQPRTCDRHALRR